jgi:hypothetical protein
MEIVHKLGSMNIRKTGHKAFWIWIAYQTIKGTLTTSLIWLPLLWAWLG